MTSQIELILTLYNFNMSENIILSLPTVQPFQIHDIILDKMLHVKK